MIAVIWLINMLIYFGIPAKVTHSLNLLAKWLDSTPYPYGEEAFLEFFDKYNQHLRP